ncbi:CCA tRNA nucleotidyltransferase [Desulfotalea psychrophila]|uniref:CCA tRNA nucleotidyltransferase n=1 Tax=Desulfotalea psychrophila TaxID=84980 RepID=UPI001389BE53|nr:HD domain-containing protein [Desulfotalea psychrophila]
MEKKIQVSLAGDYSPDIVTALFAVSRQLDAEVWVAGGPVRDYFLGRSAKDLDLVTGAGAIDFCRRLLRQLGEGSLVPLSEGDEEACRIVYRHEIVDISSFRASASSLEEDLALRDFTLNAMALPLSTLRGEKVDLIDPFSGRDDLADKILRPLPEAFGRDPLRILRAFRFQSLFSLSFDPAIAPAIIAHRHLLSGVAAERISAELDATLMGTSALEALAGMEDLGILELLLPELSDGRDILQPAAHHLDVYGHSLACFEKMHWLLAGGVMSFVSREELDLATLAKKTRLCLCWAALLHDVGKPGSRDIRATDGRITFYNHDERGARIVAKIGTRLRWSNEVKDAVARLVAMHMHPFHLCAVQQSGEVSPRAVLRLYRRAQELLQPLFLLAFADSLASQGEGRPAEMEQDIALLYRRTMSVYYEKIRPVLLGEKILTGRDILREFSLDPGPLYGDILTKVEELRVEGELATEADALAWVKKYLQGLS